jgi:hypothetical protein
MSNKHPFTIEKEIFDVVQQYMDALIACDAEKLKETCTKAVIVQMSNAFNASSMLNEEECFFETFTKFLEQMFHYQGITKISIKELYIVKPENREDTRIVVYEALYEIANAKDTIRIEEIMVKKIEDKWKVYYKIM